MENKVVKVYSIDNDTLTDLLYREMYYRVASKEGKVTFEEISEEYIRDDMGALPTQALKEAYDICIDLYSYNSEKDGKMYNEKV